MSSSLKLPAVSICTFLLLFLAVLLCQTAYGQDGSCSRFHTCCNSSTNLQCQGYPNGSGCFCDQICYVYHDCCKDILNVSNCAAPSNPPPSVNGSCAAAGFSGCCNPNTGNCFGTGGNCLCDQACYSFGDCCSDINATGCLATSTIPVTTNGTCAAAGFNTCCSSSNIADCHGSPPDCFCDSLCYNYTDCCSDIETMCAGTYPPTPDQGHCTDMGYSGCCQLVLGNSNITCKGSNGKCYCDSNCYHFGDCCEDIDQINCLSPISASPTQGSCVAAGFVTCCDSQNNEFCWGSGGSSLCYCDESCYSYNDCCSDIASIGCIAPSVTPTAGDGSCIVAGYPVCCVKSNTNQCLGSNGICYCSADCYDTGDCCQDIDKLGCVIPTPTLGACQQAGYQQCCHPSQQEGASCYGDPPTCYCDQLCYNFSDCCPDVEKIGCLNDSTIVSPKGSCVEAGYHKCCTTTDSDQLCMGYPETCYCDESCHLFGDCCEDISDIGCTKQQPGSCIDAGYSQCCPLEDLTCVGLPDSNCFCDEACNLRGDCCSDLNVLTNCAQITIPGPVNNLRTSTINDTAFTVLWDPPINSTNTFIYYIVVSNYSGAGTPIKRVQMTIFGLHKNIYGLIPRMPYNVTVHGASIEGHGINRTIIKFTKAGIPTKAPTNISITHTGTKLYVTWSPLTGIYETQGLPVSYTVQYFPSTDVTQVLTVNNSNTSITISGISSRIRYGVKVGAINSVGVGVYSSSLFESGRINPQRKVNIGLIVGSIAGGVGLLAVVIVAVLFILLICRSKNRPGGRQQYKKLLIQANSDFDDESSDEDD